MNSPGTREVLEQTERSRPQDPSTTSAAEGMTRVFNKLILIDRLLQALPPLEKNNRFEDEQSPKQTSWNQHGDRPMTDTNDKRYVVHWYS